MVYAEPASGEAGGEPGRYLTGAAGRAAYAAARAKAKPRRKPRDPQAITPLPVLSAPEAVAILMLPCATPVPGGTCGTPALGHQIGKLDGDDIRTYCCQITAAGACPCGKYTAPAQDVVG